MSVSSVSTLSGFYRGFARNVVSLVGHRAVSLLANLLLIPYIISRVGVEGYGILMAVAAVSSVVGAVDLGLGASSVKSLSEQIEQRDAGATNRVFWSTLLPLASLCLVLFVGMMGLAGLLLRLFGTPPGRMEEAMIVYALSLGATLFFNSVSVFQRLLWALHRVDVISYLHLGVIPLWIAGVVWVLETGRGLIGIACVEALTLSAIPVLSLSWIACALYPPLRFRPSLFDWTETLRLLKYGVRIQISNLATSLYAQAGRFVTGLVLGLEVLTFYELAARLALPFGMFPALVAPLFMPISSQLCRRAASEAGVQELYRKGTKFIAVVLIGLAIFGSAFAAPIMNAWVGPGYGQAALGFACLIWLQVFNGLNQVGRSITRGIGQAGLDTRYELGRTAASVSAALLGAWGGGFVGLVVALTLASVVVGVLFLRRLCRLTGVGGWVFAREVFGAPALAAGAAIGTAAGFFWVTSLLAPSAGRLVIGGTGAVFLLVYGIGVIWTGYLTPQDLWATYRGRVDEESRAGDGLRR